LTRRPQTVLHPPAPEDHVAIQAWSRASARWNAARFAASILVSIAPAVQYPSFSTPRTDRTVHFASYPDHIHGRHQQQRLEGSAIAVLFSRATQRLRPALKSRISALIPSFSRIPAMYIAASCSFPGGFVVSIFDESAASFALPSQSRRIPIGDGFIGIPGAPLAKPCRGNRNTAAIATPPLRHPLDHAIPVHGIRPLVWLPATQSPQ